MDGFQNDLRYAARLLAKRPGLTLVAVLSLALGIGANTAIFSLVDKVLLRSLPVPNPERLVTMLGRNEHGINSSFSYPNYKDLYLQHYRPDLALHVRTSGDPGMLMAAIRNEVRSLDSSLPLAGIRTLAEQKGSSLFRERMAAMFLSAFGVLALLLAAIGIYGVMAFAVSRRTREIGIRVALGASGSDVLRLVLRQGGILVLLGVAAGTAASFFATGLLGSFLYGVTTTDFATFAVVPLLLAVVALGACFLPAHRATKVDPMVALRYE